MILCSMNIDSHKAANGPENMGWLYNQKKVDNKVYT
jgi:hypothetical protein